MGRNSFRFWFDVFWDIYLSIPAELQIGRMYDDVKQPRLAGVNRFSSVNRITGIVTRIKTIAIILTTNH
ncbi:MAG: hypothetical protein L6Q47_15870 [Ignavibacteriaceae bacterium]|nr:hypothetical protein [Ignavibacteriaceae bacterium]